MNNTKKGFTLIELICGIAVLCIAVLIGAQFFSVAVNGYSRSAIMEKASNKAMNSFETGVAGTDVTITTNVANTVTISITSPTVKNTTINAPLIAVEAVSSAGNITYYGLQASFGTIPPP